MRPLGGLEFCKKLFVVAMGMVGSLLALVSLFSHLFACAFYGFD